MRIVTTIVIVLVKVFVTVVVIEIVIERVIEHVIAIVIGTGRGIRNSDRAPGCLLGGLGAHSAHLSLA